MLLALVIALLFLNSIDAGFTWYAVKVAHYGVEANPIMAWAIDHGMLAFFVLKTALMAVGIAAVLLINRRTGDEKPARIGLGACVALYSLIAAWQLYGFFLYGR